MKKLITILLILLTADLIGQIKPQLDWSNSIQTEFNEFVINERIDSLLVYYQNIGYWSNEDSCKGIESIAIMWIRNGITYCQPINCNRIMETETMTITSKPIDYFVDHIDTFKLKEKYIAKHRFLPPSQTHESKEYLILMTQKKSITIELTESQRQDSIWRQFAWIMPTIKAIDITKQEMKKTGANMR